MREIILDTNILILHWHQSRGGPLASRTADDAEGWAHKLIQVHQTDAIVTPVYIEFVCGVTNRHEMELSRAYLKPFRVIDEGVITAADWVVARQFAERIPPGPEPFRRGAVDCLIKAISQRLRHDLRTSDLGMPRSLGGR